MTVLQKGKVRIPFWGEPVNLITGLDPLGLQLTSEATYSAMLPGITNLTNRIRYYGFYCWLIDLYLQKKIMGSSREQNIFIRRAELMIALIMQTKKREVTQITGSDFADKLIIGNDKNYYDLAEGADKTEENKKVYWKYPSGAFGQYYYGAMQVLALIAPATNDDGDSIFAVTKESQFQKVTGTNLAEAFGEPLPQEVQDLFYQNIEKGKLHLKDIDKLAFYFLIDKVEVQSREWKLYKDLLFDRDLPGIDYEELFKFHRKETIVSLLGYASTNNSLLDWYGFLYQNYRSKPVLENDTKKGWYCYQLNEYWQFGCGSIFWAVLQYLDKLNEPQYLPSFIKNFSLEIKQGLKKYYKLSKVNLTVDELIEQDFKIEEEEYCKKMAKTNNPVEAAKFGFLLLFKIFAENSDHLSQIQNFMFTNRIVRDGNVIDGLNAIRNYGTKNLELFINDFILKRILNRHTMVALRKMGNGTQSTHKFIIEEQYIRLIEKYPPRNTSPRLNALRNILYDMQIIDESNLLTDIYHKFLQDED